MQGTVVFGSLIGCMLITYVKFANPIPKHDTLQQVIFIIRHGDRNPVETYPKDPHINYTWPGGRGALTKKGMLRIYTIAQWIREDYGAIIGKKYENVNTMVFSASEERSIMSAQTLLAGLFSPSHEDIFTPNLKWTPIPVYTIPKEIDKLEEALKQAFLKEEKRSSAKMAEYYKKLTKYTGKNISTILDVSYLYDTLQIEEQHGLKLPIWTQNLYNNEMREMSIRSYNLFTDDIIQKRLRGGPLLKKILQHMEETKIGPKPRRAYFYFVSDITIINVMRTMEFMNISKPDFGATLIFELHCTDNQSQEVKILYLSSTEKKVASFMEIPNCANPCLLQSLKQTWHKVIPDNWDAECTI
ncbi:PREDICTED: lysosomal acid phosphatase-like isoform X2 [Dinoponera quadriceps]|uniref:Lysosomal acid phosphatase-like isoform X2 n=1 Tax=Dinoponera quadriceps TaxID=609295 RepID=A0A6P3XZA7_DINQU|nr:PREDICTED: lysosomal acid phosphatase-like isoform X2 [Dinoponera quadriceps]